MIKEKQIEENKTSCADKICPFHGKISLRGRTFKGKVIRKFQKRICIELERTKFISKYERYSKMRTRLHARLPDCLFNEINLGDYVEIKECRPISKIIHFIAVRKIQSKTGEKNESNRG